MPSRNEDRPWQQQVNPNRVPVNERVSDVTRPWNSGNPPPHPPMEPNRDWAWKEH